MEQRTRSPDPQTEPDHVTRGKQSVDIGTHECPECEAQISVSDDAVEIVCDDCGLVVSDSRIDRGPEWRSFSTEENQQRSRVGAPMTHQLHDKGLSATISRQNVDAYGNTLASRKRRKMERLRTWDERYRSKSNQERNLKHALGEISRMAAALDIAKADTETASVIYRRALEDDLLPGRSIEGMATASLYAAARQGGVPLSLDDFAGVSRVERRRIQRAYRYLTSELKIGIAPTDPTQFVPRFASELDLSDESERQARGLLAAAKCHNIHCGKSPVALAAAAVYAAATLSNESVTQEAVGTVAHVAPVTIRKRYTELLDVYEDGAR
ncbi:transcription initiation factor IIB 2 [Haladaptatus sp. W1]|uniref:transcription initiation factor IIB n=1 Tax=Haladaptatus sp. W1 TaxID=1897478 RepID=UPI000849B78C|nr:TFIIB-type zinc ribbon-containing protein [Haladaptatus sp. W1]ODR80941.1 transcription initiation factor IIB 2 [Haladaptatus sp. W1]